MKQNTITTFPDALRQMEDTHDAKSYDYAKIENRYSNFEFAAAIADEFPDGPDHVFATMLGIKLARLAELLSEGKTPKHESIEDTFLDLSNYAVLWWTWRAQSIAPKKDTIATGVPSTVSPQHDFAPSNQKTSPDKSGFNFWGV